ncbi:hypothetical protein ES705_38313 [subsurface metagenome]
MRDLIKNAPPIIQPFGDVVVGGGRIAILDALPSKERAIKAAQKLGIILVE